AGRIGQSRARRGSPHRSLRLAVRFDASARAGRIRLWALLAGAGHAYVAFMSLRAGDYQPRDAEHTVYVTARIAARHFSSDDVARPTTQIVDGGTPSGVLGLMLRNVCSCHQAHHFQRGPWAPVKASTTLALRGRARADRWRRRVGNRRVEEMIAGDHVADAALQDADGRLVDPVALDLVVIALDEDGGFVAAGDVVVADL